MLTNLLLSLLFSGIISAAYSSTGHNVAAYWGQGPNKKTLGEYCSQGNMDIAVVSFVNIFNSTDVDYNFGGASLDQTVKDVFTCQNLGIKVFLSLGGAVGSYNVSSKQEAESVADQLYSKFGPTGSVLPNVKFDGFDLDIESGETKGYPNLVDDLRSKFGKDILISAAPQCTFPDAELENTLKKSKIDMAFIQFYNNDCNLTSDTFNWDTWKKNAKKFKNKNIKLYVGLPGSSTAAASGYADMSVVQNATSTIVNDESFGGFSVWDATYADENDNYLQQLQTYLAQQNSTSSSTTSKTTATTLSKSSTSSASSTTLKATTTKLSKSSTSSMATTTSTSSSSESTTSTTTSSETTTDANAGYSPDDASVSDTDSTTTLAPQYDSTTSSYAYATDDNDTDSYDTDSYSSDSYATDSYNTDSYSADSYATDSYSADSYATGSYDTDSYSAYATNTYGTYATNTLETSYVTGSGTYTYNTADDTEIDESVSATGTYDSSYNTGTVISNY